MDEEDDPIDDEQLEEYQEMVDDLGAFPVSLKCRLVDDGWLLVIIIVTILILYIFFH